MSMDSGLVLYEGGTHRNKGDELMLLAALEHRPPHMAPGRPILASTAADRLRLGLEGVIWPSDRRTLMGMVGEPVLGRYGNVLEFRRDREVDLVFDVSGWSYGDRWGSGTERAAARMKARGSVPTIFLPQSLGVFATRASRRAIGQLAEGAARIYARDEWSWDQIRSATRAGDVRIGPDYSVDVPPVQIEVPPEPRLCIVPNHRVIRDQADEVKEGYISMLAEAAKAAKSAGLAVRIVLHTTSQDDYVADLIDEALPFEIPRIKSNDPRELKGVLGSAHLVVGSRFHALISSMVQSVPTIGIGWAPKYRALFTEAGTEHLLVTAKTDPHKVVELLHGLLAGHEREATISALHRFRIARQTDVLRLWTDIAELIPASPGC